MRVFSAILTVCLCIKLTIQINDNASNTSNEPQSEINESSVTPNYSFDPQVTGFNSTQLTSGPIVLVDKRTLFIPDLQFQGKESLEFWAGIGSPNSSSSQKQMVQTEYIDHSTNLYIVLPEHLTLDKIGYFQVTSNDKLLDSVFFDNVTRDKIAPYNEANMEDTVFRIPKCCGPNQHLNASSKRCAEAQEPVSLNVTIFESNQTGLDPDIIWDSSNYRLVPYHQFAKCKNGYKLIPVQDLHGLIYNSSLIIQGTGILSHQQYCIDILEDPEEIEPYTITLYCYKDIESDPNFYVPVLVISAIGFGLSALAYGLILKAKDIHKRCFIIFSSSMCLAFVSLIVMQVQSNSKACNLFGFVFIFATALSYLWLLIVCLELLYLVIYPIEEHRYAKRWYWYGGISLGLSSLIFIISLFSGQLWVPDVPSPFIMGYGNDRCFFGTPYRRAFIVFVPMIVSILGSFASLIALQTYVNKNEKNRDIKTHFDWVNSCDSYKFLSRTYIMVIIVACFWLPCIFFYNHQLESGKTQLAIDVIKASLGVVTFIGFVANKYTLREIKEKFKKKKKPVITDVALGLNGMSTPETPVEIDPLMGLAPNFSSFPNNNVANNG